MVIVGAETDSPTLASGTSLHLSDHDMEKMVMPTGRVVKGDEGRQRQAPRSECCWGVSPCLPEQGCPLKHPAEGRQDLGRGKAHPEPQ